MALYIYLKFSKRVELKCSHQKDKKGKYMKWCMLINSMEGDSFHKVHVYQITLLYTLKSYNFICQLYLNKGEKKKKLILRLRIHRMLWNKSDFFFIKTYWRDNGRKSRIVS